MEAATQIEFTQVSGVAKQFELLLACCRIGSGYEIDEIIRGHVAWNGVLEMATHHRVLPPICERISSCGGLPSEARASVGARFANHQRRVLRFSAMLAAILHEFEGQQIPVLPFKGPVLSQVLYGDPAAREFGDLDLLVLPRDLPPARAALCRLGYSPKIQLSARCERDYLRSGYELGFGCRTERNLVELHWQVLPRFYSVPFELEAIFARSVEGNFAGRRVRVPSNEDLLLMLCVHAAKHAWSQLGMVRDIAALAAFNLDWDLIEAEAQRMGVMKIVCISLLLAQRMLGAELPQILIDWADRHDCDALVAALERKLEHCEDTDVESLRYFASMMRLRERWRDRVGIAWRLASNPGIEEWNAVALPDWLFPLYRGVRACRLVKRCARSLTTRRSEPPLARS